MALAEAGLDRIPREVPQELKHVAVGLDPDGVVPVAAEMSGPAVPSVESLRVGAVQALHPGLERVVLTSRSRW